MKSTTILTTAIVLAALSAFLIGPAGAEDESPAPPPRPDAVRQGPPPPARLVHAADADRDGAITAEEWKTFLGKLQEGFAALDEDGDGALSREELPRPPQPPMRGAPRGPGMGGPGAGAMGPGARGPQGMHRGPGPDGAPFHRRGPDFAGPGPRMGQGPDARPGPQGPGAMARGPQDLEGRLDRLATALEKLLERLESRPPR